MVVFYGLLRFFCQELFLDIPNANSELEEPMTPQEYEKLVAQYFHEQGYATHTTQYSGDFGVDVFAERGNERLAIQAKMFGNTTRKINREMVMQLHGAKDYFDCTKAVIATDGIFIDNALKVADKLGIEILYIKQQNSIQNSPIQSLPQGYVEFDQIWEQYIRPLEGKTLERDNGRTNQIVSVDWGGIKRITSNGKCRTIKIEIFKKTFNHILRFGSITRAAINDEYKERASSGIVLILSHVPMFELTTNPLGLRLRDKDIVEE